MTACAEVPAAGPERYVVHPEDTLYSIAWRHDLDYRDLARWNHLGPEYRISVGQVLVLGPGSSASFRSQAPPRAQQLSANRAEPRVGKPQPQPLSNPPSSVPWVWPTDRLGEPRPAASGGIILPGRVGQDVRAASAGRVVYTGSGLRGYGNLIIIKHADSWLSAYGHNREILVHDGQEVALGQVIAHMGEDNHQSGGLYFEIRQSGRPVDPLAYLSKVK